MEPISEEILALMVSCYPEHESYIRRIRTHYPSQIKKIWSAKILWEDMKYLVRQSACDKNPRWKMEHIPDGPYNIMLYNDELVLLGNSKAANPGSLKTKIYKGEKLCIDLLELDLDSLVLISYDQLLGIQDTIIARAFAILYCYVTPENYPSKVDPQTLLNLYKIFDEVLISDGNDAYKQIKMFEGLVHGTLIQITDPIQHTDDYKQYMLNEAKKAGYTSIQKIDEILRQEGMQQLCELHGIHRHWVHPSVDEIAGAVKIKNISTTRKPIRYKTSVLVRGALTKQFCIAYRKQNARWPNIKLHKLGENSKLKRILSSGRTALILQSQVISLEEWAKIEFEQNFQFDYHPDYTDLMDDKSIACILDDLPYSFDNDITGQKPKPPKTNRRMLLEILGRYSVNLKEYCKMAQERKIPLAWKIILLSAKERELKIEPRMFAMMPLEMRFVYVLQEQNIKDKIFPFYPQQSMTMDEIKSMRRLYQMSSTRREIQNCVTVIIGIDFKSWNLYWSPYNTLMFCSLLDSLFGTPGLYTYGTEFFEEATICVMSRMNPPLTAFAKLTDEDKNKYKKWADMTWTGHKGGFEGIRQKLWTWITIGILLLVEEVTGIRSQITGQGDNQVCRVSIPVKNLISGDIDDYIKEHQDEIKDRISRYMSVLTTTARDMGLEIKLEESWIAFNSLNYGKNFFVNGAIQSQQLKRIARVLIDVNQVYPNLPTKIATLQTAGLAAAQQGFDMYVPYFICQLETLMMFIKDTQRQLSLNPGKFEPATAMRKRTVAEYKAWISEPDTWRFLLLGNTDIFGTPMNHMLDYAYRGHPDPLTGYLTFLYLLATSNTCHIAKQILLWLIHKKYQIGNGSAELLIANPCSLNIKTPDLLSREFKDLIRDTLTHTAKNKDLKEIFSSNSALEDKQLAEFLIQAEPLCPRVLHEVMLASPSGSRLQLMSIWSNTRTILKSDAMKQQSTRFYRKALNLDIELIVHLKKLHQSISAMPDQDITICPTQLAIMLRNHTWSTTTGGRPIEGVTIPHPAHQFSFESISAKQLSFELTLQGSVEQIIYQLHADPSEQLLCTVGPHPAYHGNRTYEKKSGKILVITGADRPIRAASRMVEIKPWCFVDGTALTECIDAIIRSKTDIPVPILESASSKIYGGSVPHRINDHITKRTSMNNMRPNITTHMTITTDHMGKYSRGGDNWNMHFQGAMLHGYRQVASYLLSNTLTTKTTFSQKLRCFDCTQKLDERKMTHPGDKHPAIKTTRNPLLFSSVSEVTPEQIPKTSLIRYVNDHNSDSAIASILIGKFIKDFSTAVLADHHNPDPILSTVGIREVAHVGLPRIIEKLATLLVLWSESHPKDLYGLTHNMSDKIWASISDICMLPEIASTLVLARGIDGIPAGSTSSQGVPRELNSMLQKEIYRMSKNQKLLEQRIRKITFFLSDGISLYKIFRMWSYSLVLIDSLKSYDVSSHGKLTRMVREKTGGNLMVPDALDEVHAFFYSQLPQNVYYRFILNYPIRLSKYPCEAYLGQGIDVERVISDPFDLNCDPERLVLSGDYFAVLDVNLTGQNVHFLPPALAGNDPLEVDTTFRTRSDHAWRLFGTVSTAYLKYMEMIIRENIPLNGPAICTAEGEASVAKAISVAMRNKYPVYYNSLVDVSRFVPHRSAIPVPGSFLGSNLDIRGCELIGRHGGDLTDPNYLSDFLSILPESSAILTCDAEVSTKFSPEIAINIFYSLRKIIYRARPKAFIFKTFADNPKILSQIIANISLIYRNTKVIIPNYSSHQGNEIFILGQHINYCLPVLTDGHLTVCQGFEKLESPLFQLSQHRKTPDSYLATQPHLRKEFYNLSKILHFHPVAEEALRKYFCNRDFAFSSDKMDLKTLINRVQLSAVKTMMKVCIESVGVLRAGYIDTYDQILTSGMGDIPTIMETNLFIYINGHILRNAIDCRTIREVEAYLKKVIDWRFIMLFKDPNHVPTPENPVPSLRHKPPGYFHSLVVKAPDLTQDITKYSGFLIDLHHQPTRMLWAVRFLKQFWRVWGSYHDKDKL